MFSGATDWADVGRKGGNNLPRSPNTVWKPIRLENLKDLDIAAIASGPAACHAFAITADGKVYGWGRNEKGQLGMLLLTLNFQKIWPLFYDEFSTFHFEFQVLDMPLTKSARLLLKA